MLLLQELQLLCGFFLALPLSLVGASEPMDGWSSPMRPCSPPTPAPPVVGGCGPAAREQLRPAAGCQTYIVGLVSEAISSACVTINARRDAAPCLKLQKCAARGGGRSRLPAGHVLKVGIPPLHLLVSLPPHRPHTSPHIDLKEISASCTSHSTVGLFQSKPRFWWFLK